MNISSDSTPNSKYDADFSGATIGAEARTGVSANDAKKVVDKEDSDSQKRTQARHEQNIKNMCQERELRDRYARKAYRVCKKSMKFLAGILIWQGVIATFCKRGPFSDSLLLALITAVTVNVFAAFLCITRGLFQKEKNTAKNEP